MESETIKTTTKGDINDLKAYVNAIGVKCENCRYSNELRNYDPIFKIKNVLECNKINMLSKDEHTIENIEENEIIENCITLLEVSYDSSYDSASTYLYVHRNFFCPNFIKKEIND